MRAKQRLKLLEDVKPHNRSKRPPWQHWACADVESLLADVYGAATTPARQSRFCSKGLTPWLCRSTSSHVTLQ